MQKLFSSVLLLAASTAAANSSEIQIGKGLVKCIAGSDSAEVLSESIMKVWTTPETRRGILTGCKIQDPTTGYNTCDKGLDLTRIASQNYASNQSISAIQ